MEQTVKILFVCLGNICRSPSAEAVMQKTIDINNLTKKILCDSAGTSAAHVGAAADSRSTLAAKARGYDITSIARQVVAADFIKFDLLVAMDDNNYNKLKALCPDSKLQSKILRFVDFCKLDNPGLVPDPYYGGQAGFEIVLDILEDGCQGLLDYAQHY